MVEVKVTDFGSSGKILFGFSHKLSLYNLRELYQRVLPR